MSSRIDEIRRRHQDGPFGACETCDVLAELARVEAERDEWKLSVDEWAQSYNELQQQFINRGYELTRSRAERDAAAAPEEKE